MSLIITPSSTSGSDRPDLLDDDAVAFVALLHDRFAERRDQLLADRARRRPRISAAGTLELLAETAEVREGTWTVPPPPPALRRRRVEMTGPATPAKMAINALNSGADIWLADLEDASCPTWENVLDAIGNLRDAARGVLSFDDATGRPYRLRTDRALAIPVTRPRGWHLDEAHLRVLGADGERDAIGALVDFGLHVFHVGPILAAGGQGPYYYLPKLEHHLEARLWHDVFACAEDELRLAPGTIRATVLIETIPAAFQMEEILHQLGPYASGLNAGRWDYLFSIIKTFRDAGPSFVLPDRSQVTMTAPFMRAYTELLVSTCHRRGAFAMGGMAAFIPNRHDPEINRVALEKVREDKAREASDGFDGSWVAHPDLVEVCAEAFDQVLGERPNQLDRRRDDVTVAPAALLDIASCPGSITEAGLRGNLSVALAYLAAWLSGTGAVAINNLMEDAATAEISRSQVWQQVHNRVVLDDTGEQVTAQLVERLLAEESARLREGVDVESYRRWYVPATDLVRQVCLAEEFVEFLTLPAYQLIR